MILGHGSWIIEWSCSGVHPESTHRPPRWAEVLVTISLQPPKNECQKSVNNFWSWMMDNQRAME